MTKSKSSLRMSSEALLDQRSALVKQMVEKENAALDAKTARLKALRLAKEAAEPPVPEKKKPIAKRSRSS